MNKFIVQSNLKSKLNQEKINNLNRLITYENTELKIKSFPPKNCPDTDEFTTEFYHAHKTIKPILFRQLRKTNKQKEYS